MDQANTLRRYGLFDAKVPRYTSYPPANRFEIGVGAQRQEDWLRAVPEDVPVSVYIHIPFCRRLCWFCACRTQGTKTLRPVQTYLDRLIREIETTTDAHLPQGIKLGRLHLGGGTPTLLSAPMMDRLLRTVYSKFERAEDFEFSVEVDPTEADHGVLDTLAAWGMNRASVGVQDFAPAVQEAIGRIQPFKLTSEVIGYLRACGIDSLNIDFLYGLPFQNVDTLTRTLDQVVALKPDRLALYGYAHVPHVSKRQVMIPDEALPNPEERFVLSQLAKDRLETAGYRALGIDHFALPEDSLAQAAHAGRMRRNFQGYTDDPCETLLGFGASAISKFRQGYLQNAVATSAYSERVDRNGLAGHKGYALTPQDRLVAAMVSSVMCDGHIPVSRIAAQKPEQAALLERLVDDLMLTFPDLLVRSKAGLTLPPACLPAARLIAARLDTSLNQDHIHSLAV